MRKSKSIDVEYIMLFFIFIILCCILYLMHTSFKEKIYNNVTVRQNSQTLPTLTTLPTLPIYPSLQMYPNDVLLNPYTPPLRNEQFFNIPTNIGAIDSNYRQVGILTPLNYPNRILPLMGRPLFTNRDKWQFYTFSDNNIKLPMVYQGKSCTNEYGCNNLYNNDMVYVEGYKEGFKVTTYDNDTIKYIPAI